jgi:hypothetical protein
VLSGTQLIGNCAPASLSVTLTGTPPWNFTYSYGTGSATVNNINSSPYIFTVSPASTVTYSISALSDSKCTSQASDRTGNATVTVPTGSAGVWTGAINNDWFDCRNWANGKTPVASEDVTISNTINGPQISTASSFAVSSGNVAKCRNLVVDNSTIFFAAATDVLLASGNVTIQNNGTIDMTAGGTLEIQGDWNDQVNNAGKGYKSGMGKVVFSGSATQSISTIKTTELFYNLQINKTTSGVVNLNKSIIVDNDLSLTSGIFATGNNLFTWNNTGTLSAPESSYTPNSSNYTKSFIATCDNTGTPLNLAGATSPFTGSAGFQIKNVGNANTYFPVGPSFLAGTTGQPASPNRMMINNQSGTPQDYTVIVNYGDIGYTNGSGGSLRVNRIWYVKAGGAGTGKATMRLFFTKRNWAAWGIGENEVEAGFVYARPALVQKDYTGGYGNFINLSGSGDITDFTGNTNNTEVYGQYTIGISDSLTNGIVQFNRFSVVNPGAIILPVTITNVKAYQVGEKIKVDWTSLNELTIDHYDVEKSTNGVNFITIVRAQAYNNGKPRNDYSITDNNPAKGNNFYRIKVLDKDGHVSYTIVVRVNISIDNGKASVVIMPNPVHNKTMTVLMNDVAAGKYSMIMYDAAGHQVYQKVLEHAGGSAYQTINLPTNISLGTYVVRIFNGTINYSIKVIVE